MHYVYVYFFHMHISLNMGQMLEIQFNQST